MLVGYIEAKRLLRELRPDVLLIKGGFVAVPMGLAAARLKIPFITHDSDSTPGLANRIISRWATLHATGMPAELYNYPRDKTIYTGIPVSADFRKVSPSLRATYRESLGLSGCSKVITIVGGSQGAGQLNEDMVKIASRLMQRYEGLGIVHVAGQAHAASVKRRYGKELLADELRRVVIEGFVPDVHIYQGAADVVISRAGATQVAELAMQALPIVIVPGKLAGAHQDKNAAYLTTKQAALTAPHGDADRLYDLLNELLSDIPRQRALSDSLHGLAKPDAARELAKVTLDIVRG